MENIPKNVISKPVLPKAWDLFKQSVGFYKENLKFVFSLFIIPLLLMLPGMILLGLLRGTEEKDLLTFSGDNFISFVLGILFVIAGSIISYVVSIAFIRYLTEKEKGSPDVSLNDHVKYGFKIFSINANR